MRRTTSIGMASSLCFCSLLLTAGPAFAQQWYFASDIVRSGGSGRACGKDQSPASATASLIWNLQGGASTTILTTEANNCYDDISSYDVLDSKWRSYLPPYQLWAVPGNHDYFNKNGGDDHLATAFKTRISSSTYFSTTYGNDWLVLGIDSELDTSTTPTMAAQTAWLESLLAANQALQKPRPCIMAISHRPAFTNAKKHSSDRLDSGIVALLKNYNVRLLLSGHEHVYERLEQNGLMQIVAGTGGADLNPSPAFTSPNEPGYIPSIYQDNTSYGVVSLGLWDENPGAWPPAGFSAVFWDTSNNFKDMVYTTCKPQ